MLYLIGDNYIDIQHICMLCCLLCKQLNINI